MAGADEPRDADIGRAVVELLRRAELEDLPVHHHRDPVRHGHRLDLVVGDVEESRSKPAIQRGDLGARLQAHLRVEIGERFVEQEGGWLAYHRTPERHTLSLAAGELSGPPVEQMGDIEHVGDGADARLDLPAPASRTGQDRTEERQALRRRQPPHAERHRDVAGHGEVGIERVALEHHRQISVGSPKMAGRRPADLDTALVGALEPRHDAQEGGFSASRGPDQRQEFPVGDRQVDLLQDLRRPERFAQAPERERCHLASSDDELPAQ